METEIKIDLVPKEQINEKVDYVRITCGNICAWGNCLEAAIKAFDEALRQHKLNSSIKCSLNLFRKGNMNTIKENAETIKKWLEHLNFEYEHPGYGKDIYKKLDEIIEKAQELNK